MERTKEKRKETSAMARLHDVCRKKNIYIFQSTDERDRIEYNANEKYVIIGALTSPETVHYFIKN